MFFIIRRNLKFNSVLCVFLIMTYEINTLLQLKNNLAKTHDFFY